jgi:hypothetical protein
VLYSKFYQAKLSAAQCMEKKSDLTFVRPMCVLLYFICGLE